MLINNRRHDNWMQVYSITLGKEDAARRAELCKRHNMNFSELVRWLLLEEIERKGSE